MTDAVRGVRNRDEWARGLTDGQLAGVLEAGVQGAARQAVIDEQKRRHESDERSPAKPPRMNKTEAAYEHHLLSTDGEIAGIEFEAVRLRLADKTWYTPDFMVTLDSGAVEFHEVKGRIDRKAFVRDDAMVKIKVAARLYPWRFVMAWPYGNGGWRTREFRGE